MLFRSIKDEQVGPPNTLQSKSVNTDSEGGIESVRIKRVEFEVNRVFSHDVTVAILVSQNNETAAMLVSKTNPLGVELFSYFVPINLHRCWPRE